jgi:2-polyprenyl-3-methyl-5-hydroxy-6-metoxy-1,4-benzoquinol methylase
MARYVQFYHLPEDLRGKAILDIGSASGYFALECARRGGRVTAIDIYDDCFLRDLLAVLPVDIHYVKKSVYDLEASFGLFDLVVCGSVLLHLPDQLGAIRRIRTVCRGQAVVSTACPPDSVNNPRPICEFTGEKATDGDYWQYWTVGAAALRRMLLVSGFARVENEHHFTLATEPGRTVIATPHVVMTASV